MRGSDTAPDQALVHAAGTGDAAAAAEAISRGADVNARGADRRAALSIAVLGDHVEVAKVLVAAGADPDAMDDIHDTPWLLTGETGSVAMAEVLLEAEPDLTLVNRYGGVSVIPASERGHVGYVRLVARSGIDVNHVNRLGWTALLECVLLGDGSQRYREIAGILRDAGADVHIGDKDGVDAVEHARRRGFDDIAAVLTR
jgi:ankyrin repeat protein